MQIPEGVIFSCRASKPGSRKGIAGDAIEGTGRPPLPRKVQLKSITTASKPQAAAAAKGLEPSASPATSGDERSSSKVQRRWVQHDQEARRLAYFRSLLVQDMSRPSSSSDSESLLTQLDKQLQRHRDAIAFLKPAGIVPGKALSSGLAGTAATLKQACQALSTQSNPADLALA